MGVGIQILVYLENTSSLTAPRSSQCFSEEKEPPPHASQTHALLSSTPSRKKDIFSARCGFTEVNPLATELASAHSRCLTDICLLWAACISFPFLPLCWPPLRLLSSALIFQGTPDLCYRISSQLGEDMMLQLT